MEQPNEDLVFHILTTAGEMRIYPQDGLWTVQAMNTAVTGQLPLTVAGLDSFGPALAMAMRAIYNPTIALDNERTLKAQVVGGLVGPMMDEYREAVAKHEAL